VKLKWSIESQAGLSIDLNTFMQWFYTQYVAPVIELSLNAGEIAIGKSLGVNLQEQLIGRTHDAKSSGSSLKSAMALVFSKAISLQLEKQKTLSIKQTGRDSRYHLLWKHNICKEVKIILGMRIAHKKTRREHIIDEIVMIGTD